MAPLDRKLLAAALSEDRVAAPTKAERQNMHEVIGRSFAGTKTSPPEAGMNWLLGPHFTNFEDPERAKVAAFWMSFAVASLGPKCTTLCTRGANGEVSAVLLVRQCEKAPGSSQIVDAFRSIGNFIARLIRKEIPDTYAKQDPENLARKNLFEPGSKKRTDKFGKTIELMHEENADAPHIYVNMLATDPGHQRKGFGGSLMRAALRAADEAGLPAYLETGDTNRAFYEGFGFEVVKTYALSDDTDAGWPDYEAYHAMVRKAR